MRLLCLYLEFGKCRNSNLAMALKVSITQLAFLNYISQQELSISATAVLEEPGTFIS